MYIVYCINVIFIIIDYETRCPKGKKTVLYHKAKVEKYAPYLNADGLVEKIVVYVDSARKSWYKILLHVHVHSVARNMHI